MTNILLVLILLTLMGVNVFAWAMGVIRSAIHVLGWLFLIGITGLLCYGLGVQGSSLVIGVSAATFGIVYVMLNGIFWSLDRLWAWNDERRGIIRPWD